MPKLLITTNRSSAGCLKMTGIADKVLSAVQDNFCVGPIPALSDYWGESSLSLSPLAEALLRGEDDFARHARIDRWWGGTRLTNDRLWRWNAATETVADTR